MHVDKQIIRYSFPLCSHFECSSSLGKEDAVMRKVCRLPFSKEAFLRTVNIVVKPSLSCPRLEGRETAYVWAKAFPFSYKSDKLYKIEFGSHGKPWNYILM